MGKLRDFLVGTRFSRAMLQTSTVTAVVLLAAFSGVTIYIQVAVAQAFSHQEMIRHAQLQRSGLLKLQLDEETSMRGYAATGQRLFLTPFAPARASFPTIAQRLQTSLRNVEPALLPLLAQQRSLNRTWMTSVGLPILRRPSRSDRLDLELEGKTLIDRFRILSDQMSRSLNDIADSADIATRLLIGRIVLWAIIFGVALTLALIGYTLIQGRLVQQLELQYQAYAQEKHVSESLHAAFIPKELPRLPYIVLDAVYVPAEQQAQVGGDWYDAFELPDKRVLFSIGDVAGHGAEAAVIMSYVRQAILSVGLHERDPAAVLARTNEVLMLQSTVMVTAICGYIDPSTLEIAYASAGHPAPMLVTEERRASYLPHFGAPLGVLRDPDARTFTQRVKPGSLLVLYTDGILEQYRNIVEGEQRLLDLSKDLPLDSERPATTILQKTLGEVAPLDDIAILTFRFMERLLGEWHINRANVASVKKARTAFATLLSQIASHGDVEASELIFGELVSNAVEHGTGAICARLFARHEGLLLVVSDGGNGVVLPEPGSLPPPTALRGRGLHIVRSLSRNLDYFNGEGCAVAALLPIVREPS